MHLNQLLRTDARRAMSGAWGRGAGLLLLSVAPALLLNLVEQTIRAALNLPVFLRNASSNSLSFTDAVNLRFVSLLLSLLMLVFIFLLKAPVDQGLSRWYYRRSGGEDDGLAETFYYFESLAGYGKSLWLRLSIAVRVLFFGILFFLPAGGLIWFYRFYLRGGTLQPSAGIRVFMVLMVSMWGLIAMLLTALVGLRYFLAPYLLSMQPQGKTGLLLRKSVRLMRGNKGDVLLFQLEFLPYLLPVIVSVLFYYGFNHSVLWIISVLLLMLQGVTLLFLHPYAQTACAMYARYLLEHDERLKTAISAENETREYSTGELGKEQPLYSKDLFTQTAAKEMKAEEKSGEPITPSNSYEKDVEKNLKTSQNVQMMEKPEFSPFEEPYQ